MIAFARAYLEIAVLLAIGALAVGVAARTALGGAAAGAAARWRAIGAIWVIAAFLLPAAARLAPGLGRGRPALMLWSKPPVAGSAPAAVTSLAVRAADGVRPRVAAALSDRQLTLIACAWAAVIAALVLRALLIHRALARFCAAQPVVRRRGRVRICACDELGSPISACVAGAAFIVIPTAMWTDAAAIRMVLAHEAVHLRRGHLRGAWFAQALKIAFFWNPAVYVWARITRYLEELICDAEVAARHGAHVYARCLLWAATIGRAPVYQCEGSLPMARGSEDLGRRLGMLFDKVSTSSGRDRGAVARSAPAAALMVVLAVMAGTAFAQRGALGDRRIDEREAQAMADRVRRATGFAVPVDDWVVAKLNDLVGPRRERTLRAFARARPLRAPVERHIEQAGLPAVLLAVPFAESSFDLVARSSLGSLGLWQLMPETARKLGLEVDAVRDERLDAARSTEAAVSHLRDLHQTLGGDWSLAIAAYNSGLERVQAAIAEQGTSDVAVLARSGKLGSDAKRGYAQTVLAWALLLFDPEQQAWLNAESRD
jgi:beta-lactamase regulating signal transducer with metallopeptidase domain